MIVVFTHHLFFGCSPPIGIGAPYHEAALAFQIHLVRGGSVARAGARETWPAIVTVVKKRWGRCPFHADAERFVQDDGVRVFYRRAGNSGVPGVPMRGKTYGSLFSHTCTVTSEGSCNSRSRLAHRFLETDAFACKMQVAELAYLRHNPRRRRPGSPRITLVCRLPERTGHGRHL